jgi:hypothetical protein
MRWTRWLLLPGLLALMVAPQVASGQTAIGDKPVTDYRPLPIDNGSAARLKLWLLQSGQFEGWEKVIEEMKKNPEKYKNIANDPDARKNLEKLLGDGKLDVEKLKAIKKGMEEQVKSKQEDPRIDQKDPVGKWDPNGPPPKKPGLTPPVTSPPPEATNRFDKMINKVIKNGLDGKYGSTVKNQPAWQKAADLMKNSGGKGSGSEKSGSSDAFEKALDKTGAPHDGSKPAFLENLNPFKSSKDGDDAGAASPVASGAPGNLGKLAGPPSFNLPSGNSVGGGLAMLQILLFLAVALVVFGLIWRLLAQTRARSVQDALRRAVWPVLPGQVSTRQQLIQAFEHLALVVLGPSARSTNHRAIADGLGATPARTQAADELATLYERARYDPVEGELPATDIAAARRDLCLLAGMAAS